MKCPNIVLPMMPALQYLMPLVKGVWDHSNNKPASGSAVRRWISEGTIVVNGERVTADEMLDYPVFSIVVFPKSDRRRITLF